jgi:SAM-dependent methyltransferase
MPKLYDELADWFPLLSPPAEYAEEAAYYARTLEAASAAPVRSVLELGSGGGHNACHLKRRFDMVLVEPSAGMRALSGRLNPECEHVDGDMRSVRLAREFEAVFVHDAVCYMTTETDLRMAMQTAFVHCRAGGVALFAPDFVRETFRPSTDHGGLDEELRGLRYLEWKWDPDPSDTTYVVDYAYLLRAPEGTACEYDRHIEGLFARSDWIRLLKSVGFEAARSVPFEHSEVEPGSHEVLVAKRPRTRRAPQ